MKPHFHNIQSTAESSFSVRHDRKQNFGTLWHFHPELELHFIVKGRGIQYIGDNVSSFTDGDLVFLGENLPHTWRCADEYFRGDLNMEVEAVVLQFLPSCLGRDFFKLPETKSISVLFEKAKKGMILHGETKERIIKILPNIIRSTRLEKIVHFLEILQILATTYEYKTISPGYASRHLINVSEMQRLDKIYTYVLANYKEDINLEKIAGLAHLSISSFCRYFKTKTNKTFFQFLIEIRVSNACRALLEDKLPVKLICYDCGFNNVSNFYRQFKKITGMTPLEYKKQYCTSHHL